MKKLVLLFFCMFLMSFLFAQTNFQELDLAGALEKAKGEGKMVLVDCYTSWCGPCKMMASKILPLKEVGDFLNERFVCVKYDMEKGEGPEIAKKYGVEAYPTFLLLKADGTLIQPLVGMTTTGEEFVYKVKLALGDISTVKMDSLYANGHRMTRFVLSYLKALQATEQFDKARAVSSELLKTMNDSQKSFGTYWFIYEDVNISPIGSENVNYLLDHADNFRKGVGEKTVNAKLAALLETQLEDILRGRNKNASLADVEKLKQRLEACNLPGREDLSDYVTLAKAMITKDAGQALSVCKKLFTSMSDEKLAYLYFHPILTLKGKWSDAHKKELDKMSRDLSKRVKNVVLKDGLVNFANAMIPNL
ncbi:MULTISPECIES: thioredoxin family protein [Butyricimonas]|uniref:thioredoxin family protein n=1 Tax=Butyricimonas TaxID=574697 RepID=UPI0007FB2D1D|nr:MULTISPECIES: thioredoxin family protein [Butyricimonas]